MEDQDGHRVNFAVVAKPFVQQHSSGGLRLARLERRLGYMTLSEARAPARFCGSTANRPLVAKGGADAGNFRPRRSPQPRPARAWSVEQRVAPQARIGRH